jgi:hypothetical protein
LDALDADPDNQEVLVMLLLALTEQFDHDTACVAEAWRTVARLRDDYERAYFTGIIYERRAKAHVQPRHPTSRTGAYEWLREAMTRYEKAETIRPPGNDDALLRWNAWRPAHHARPPSGATAEEPHDPILQDNIAHEIVSTDAPQARHARCMSPMRTSWLGRERQRAHAST